MRVGFQLVSDHATVVNGVTVFAHHATLRAAGDARIAKVGEAVAVAVAGGQARVTATGVATDGIGVRAHRVVAVARARAVTPQAQAPIAVNESLRNRLKRSLPMLSLSESLGVRPNQQLKNLQSRKLVALALQRRSSWSVNLGLGVRECNGMLAGRVAGKRLDGTNSING